MSIEFDDRIRGVWFVAWDGADWMAAAIQEPDGRWHGKYRVRYHKDDNAFDSADRKSWVSLSHRSDIKNAPSLINAMSQMSEFIAFEKNGKRWELLRGTSTLDQFWEEFIKLPFVHAKVVPNKKAKP